MTLFLTLASWLYTFVVECRNRLFDKGLLPVWTPPIATICVGNLAVGGTGKTPHTEYMVRLLKSQYKIAILSRGYRRATKGFILSDALSKACTIGDEPMQMHCNYPDVPVAVCESRVVGVKKLLEYYPDLDVVILDDVFQHRYIKSGYSLVLTAYNGLYVQDKMLPLGRLREPKHNILRADMVVVTKCPENLTSEEKNRVVEILHLSGQKLVFSHMQYGELKPVFKEGNTNINLLQLATQQMQICMLTGIAAPEYMKQYLEKHFSVVKLLAFSDHKNFTEKDIRSLTVLFNTLPINERIIITTEKDAVRLLESVFMPENLKPFVYALPISVNFGKDTETIHQIIQSYVRKNKRNR